jgi:SAM-dependent methyltransferase
VEHDAAMDRLRPYIQRARGFSGWDLSFIRMRILDAPPAWDYVARARELAAKATRVLDIGTGGGEVYSDVLAGQPGRFVACEEWVVNAGVARDRLGPLGVPVVRCQTGERALPFPSRAFDLVLARHEAIDPVEVDRILSPGGTFLTQQVIPDVWPELHRCFPRAAVFPDHWREYPAALRALGYDVQAQRQDYRVTFESLGDLVAMLLISPWEIPAFDPESDLDALLALESELSTPEGIVLRDGRYIVEARKGV